MYKVVAIGDQDFCAGFALAGIETRVTRAHELDAEIDQAIRCGDYGVVIIDEQVSDRLEAIRPGASASHIPIVIPVPGRMQWHDIEKLDEDKYITGLIRQAVGYQLDLQL